MSTHDVIGEKTRELDDFRTYGNREALKNVFRSLKDIRRAMRLEADLQAREEMKSAYIDLVRDVNAAVFSEIGLSPDGEFTVLVKGADNFYVGACRLGGKEKFVKITDTIDDSEIMLFRSVYDGKVKKTGDNYAYHVPDYAIETSAFRMYVFDEIKEIAKLRMNLQLFAGKSDLDLVLRGLAEGVSKTGVFSYEKRPRFLPTLDTRLPPMKRDRLERTFPLPEDDMSALHRRLADLSEGWERVERAFQRSLWGFAPNDLKPDNGIVVDGKVVFVDMGRSCFAPIGANLYRLIFINQHIPNAEYFIVMKFKDLLEEYGIHLSFDEIHANAIGQYCLNWLRSPSVGTFEHFLATLDRAEALLGEHPG